MRSCSQELVHRVLTDTFKQGEPAPEYDQHHHELKLYAPGRDHIDGNLTLSFVSGQLLLEVHCYWYDILTYVGAR